MCGLRYFIVVAPEYAFTEEQLEIDFYGEESIKFMPNILELFHTEREAVLKSATRQR